MLNGELMTKELLRNFSSIKQRQAQKRSIENKSLQIQYLGLTHRFSSNAQEK